MTITRLRTLAVVPVAFAVLSTAGCSTKAPTTTPSPSPSCTMVGPAGCETVAPGTNTSALDSQTTFACNTIAKMATNPGSLADQPLQPVIDAGKASPNEGVRFAANMLQDRWQLESAAEKSGDAMTEKLNLATAAIDMETACTRAEWRAGQ